MMSIDPFKRMKGLTLWSFFFFLQILQLLYFFFYFFILDSGFVTLTWIKN